MSLPALDSSDCPSCGRDSCEGCLPAWMPPRAKCHKGCPVLDVAVGLVGLGYAPFPIGEGKRPLVKWGEFHVTPPTWRVLYNDWSTAWSKAAGIGVIAGFPHGLVVVDADDEASWAWVQENLPAVRGVRTRRGGHLHFRHPARGIIGNRSGVKAVTLASGIKVDVKGAAGYAVGPYSRHPSGHVYVPMGDWSRHVSDLPILPDIVARQAEDRPPAPAPPPPPRKPGDTDLETALEAYFKKAGNIPPEGSGSDDAVFGLARWLKRNQIAITEPEFVSVVRGQRPEFAEGWVAEKWRSATGRARR